MDENITLSVTDVHNITSNIGLIYNSTLNMMSSTEGLMMSSTESSMTSNTQGAPQALSEFATAMMEEVLRTTSNTSLINNDTQMIHITSHTELTAWNAHAQVRHTSTSLPLSMHVMPTHRIESTLTGWITSGHSIIRIHENYNVLYIMFGIMVFCLLFVVCLVQIRKKFLLLRYERLPVTNDQKPTHIYKPSHGGLLDEEYENTFVGMSIPILQDVTKV
jgi:hypothetical protein